MDFYYVVIDFYPDLSKVDTFEEVLIPYATFEEAADAIEATMDIMQGNLGMLKLR